MTLAGTQQANLLQHAVVSEAFVDELLHGLLSAFSITKFETTEHSISVRVPLQVARAPVTYHGDHSTVMINV